MKKIKNKVNAVENVVKFVFTLCGFLVIGFVILITMFLIVNGLPAIKEIGFADFFFNSKWAFLINNLNTAGALNSCGIAISSTYIALLFEYGIIVSAYINFCSGEIFL